MNVQREGGVGGRSGRLGPKNANLPIKHAFSHQKRGLRAGWESNPKVYVGKARPWSEVEVRGLEVKLGATL